MTRDEYESLVRRLEQEAQANPVGYRRKLGALALLGYGYLAAAVVLLITCGVLIGCLSAVSAALLLILKKAGFALVVLSFVATRALCVRFTPPNGHRITARDCPQLFRLIEDVRAKLRAPRADRVLLTGDFNAAIVQHARFGLFGTRNYLLLGLPLMQCLSAPEFEAVIAHELGHLSGAHGRFGAWIYRCRVTWGRLVSALQSQPGWSTALFNRFFNWYGPLFDAYSFVQARQQEYEADRMSVEVVGAGPTASALLRVSREGEFIGEKFWPGVFRRADEAPVPDVAPFTLLGTALRGPQQAPAREDWLTKALSQRTGYADTHPCLRDRLQAIGMEPREPDPVRASAAEVLLGSAGEKLRRELDEGWRARVRNWWARRHQYARDAQVRLEALELKSRTETLTEDELWDRARLTDEFGSNERALALYAEVLERNPHHVGALWRRGQMLLARDDARGIEQVSAAARIDPALEQSACAAVVGYHRRNGREAEAKEYEQRYLRSTTGAEVRGERITIRARDPFMPHGLDPASTAVLARRLQSIEGVRQALLVRKPLKGARYAVLVLGIESTAPRWKLLDTAAERELVTRVGRECRVVPELLVVSLQTSGGLRGPLRRVPGSEIYRRPAARR